MNRRPFVAGNWKMNLERRAAKELARALRDRIGEEVELDIAVFPTFFAVEGVREVLDGSRIRVGAQNCHFEASGAFTGEVSSEMVRDAGAELVLVGHSERRHLFGETDDVVARKLRAALRAGLEPILCVGETIEERRAWRTEEVLARQATSALDGLGPEELSRITLAYEPVWAIGTGETATPEVAEAAHAFLRELLSRGHSPEAAATTRIQYGGSVKADNIGGLMHEPDVDGALVGGASLDVESFVAIVRAGRGS